MKIKSLAFALSLGSLSLAAGVNPKSHGFTSGTDVFGTRVFIENKGQYNGAINTADPIKYKLDNGAEQIFFTPRGLVYKFIKGFPLTERQHEAIEHGKTVVPKAPILYYVHMNWIGANSNIQIEQSEKQNHYFTFGTAELNSYGYKKITYKNVYNNIDIEYTIPEDKDDGIKYNVILHPGANPNDVKIAYTGDVTGISQKKGGDIIIKTPQEDITEHAPMSYYDTKQSVASAFNLQNDVISFIFPNGYDNSKTLTIDPWVTTLTSMSANNYGYDIDYDYFGNLFVYGGGASSQPFKVAMFNSAGALQWTFMGTVTTPTWNSAGNYPSNNYAGNFVVNKFNSKTYIGEGFNSTGSQIIRITSTGVYDNLITPKMSTWQECWDMGFLCSTGDVYGLGGSTTSNKSAGIVNQTTGNITPQTFVPSNPSAGQDIASNAIDDFGNVFIYYASSAGINNNIARCNAAFTGTVWGAASTYNNMNESANRGSYVGTSISANGFNILAVNNNYLYYYDGLNLAAYNKTTGVKIASTTIAGQTLKQQGGIAVDDCDNVYVGGNNVIKSYNFTGTAFNALPSINCNALSANKYVYDIKLDRNSNLLYVAGSGFVGTYSAINSLTCVQNQFTLTTTCMGNNNATAVASLTTTIGSPSINYIWTNGSGTVSATTATSATSNTVTNLANGTYTLTMQINPPCGPLWTDTFSIHCVQLCSVVATASTSCVWAGSQTSLSVLSTNGYTATPSYTWAGPGGYSSNLQNPVFLNNNVFGPYTVTASDGGCTYSTVVTASATSQFTPAITNTAVLCYGGSSGLASVTVPGGTGVAPYTYTWTTSPLQNSSNAVSLSAGTYSCYVMDSKGCVFSATTQVTQPTQLTLAVNASTLAACLGTSVTLNGVAGGGVGPYTYTWSSGGPNTANFTTTEAVSGNYNYNLTVSDANGCTNSNGKIITYYDLPVVTVANVAVCEGDLATFVANGANSYVWQPGNYTGNTYTVNGVSSMAVSVVGVANGCAGTGTANLTVNPLPTTALSSSPKSGCIPFCVDLSAATTNSIVSYTWSLNDGGIGNSAGVSHYCIPVAGHYTVNLDVVDNNGCKNKRTPIVIDAWPIPTADFNINGDYNTDDPEIHYIDASYHDINQWFWYFGDGTTGTEQNPVHVFNETKIYNTFLIATSIHGCSDTVSKFIKIEDMPALYVPNSFTPNNDGMNDLFYAKGVAISKFNMTIFDRWGEKIFESNDINKAWDGTVNGKLVTEDTYVWHIVYSSNKFKAKTITGHVTLIK